MFLPSLSFPMTDWYPMLWFAKSSNSLSDRTRIRHAWELVRPIMRSRLKYQLSCVAMIEAIVVFPTPPDGLNASMILHLLGAEYGVPVMRT